MTDLHVARYVANYYSHLVNHGVPADTAERLTIDLQRVAIADEVQYGFIRRLWWWIW